MAFWDKVDKEGPVPMHRPDLGPCWIWLAGTSMGYGICRLQPRARQCRAHRAAWTLTYGPVPKGAYVLHHCDMRLCCNPSHLYLGDHACNQQDARDRQRYESGEDHHAAKLTWVVVDEIRQLFATSSDRAIARRFGVARETIRAVRRGHTWREDQRKAA